MPRTAVSATLWGVWAAVLAATLINHPVSLTIERIAAPGVVAIAIAASAQGRPSAAQVVVALGWALSLAVVIFLPRTALACINGPAYPNERRYPLAVPAAVLAGPLELAWLLTVGLPATSVWLLADRHWIAGPITAVLTLPVVVILARALHGLSRRWIVFVPAGMVLHDPATLTDPVLFTRQIIEQLTPAPADSAALDLTQRAPGLAVELVLAENVPIGRVVPGRRGGDHGVTARLLFTPTRPGAVLAEAARRRLPVPPS